MLRKARYGILLSITTLVFLMVMTGNAPAHAVSAEASKIPAIQNEKSASASCTSGHQDSGAEYLICTPPVWNHDLVVYAHGYVPYNAPVAIPNDQLMLGGVSITETITSLGYAFATTSYYTNGLAIQAGLTDLVDLVNVFKTTQNGTPAHIYLIGLSEGGLITTLAVEQHADVFDGGLAMCGPVSGLRQQTEYFGDFRVVFDYFFPGMVPGEPITIPQSLMDNWYTHAAVIGAALQDPANTYSLTQVLNVTQAAYDPLVPATALQTSMGLLYYNVFATNDAATKLGGNPFDNWQRVYAGSMNDTALNAGVDRFQAAPSVLNEMQAHYEPTGQLSVPLVTLHTTLDEIVPYRHEALYRAKIESNLATAWHHNIEIPRYGHCNFQSAEVLTAFMQLVNMVNSQKYQVFLPMTVKH